jgi:hypothetical protein
VRRRKCARARTLSTGIAPALRSGGGEHVAGETKGDVTMSNKDPNKKLQLRKLTIRELTQVSGGTCGMTRWTGCEGCSQRSEISRKR